MDQKTYPTFITLGFVCVVSLSDEFCSSPIVNGDAGLHRSPKQLREQSSTLAPCVFFKSNTY